MRTPRPLTLLALVVGLALPAAVSCVHTEKPRKPVESLSIVVTRDQRGALVSWNTLRGNYYSVQYKTRGETRFNLHPQAINMRAREDKMTFLDTAPDYMTRSYRIHPFPISGKPVPPKAP